MSLSSENVQAALPAVLQYAPGPQITSRKGYQYPEHMLETQFPACVTDSGGPLQELSMSTAEHVVSPYHCV